ncbi:MAG: ABC transporter ATP-binding protein [Planctomycetota bacterium]|nr:ABC transporter ATP-binding protein [Planctomycetota bacterium]
MTIVSAKGLTHAYRRFPGHRIVSLSGVDLEVSAGECWGLVGPNGSGKSTLLRILAGLSLPVSGELSVLGEVGGSRSLRGRIGYAPETIHWPPSLTVESVLGELAALSGVAGSQARVEEVARRVGIESILSRRMGTLSLGQARRVVVGQALLEDPPLLLLDEPFASLDSLVVHDVQQNLIERQQEGTAVILATHRIEDLREFASHIMLLKEGSVVSSGPAEDFFSSLEERGGLLEIFGVQAAKGMEENR